MKLHRLVILDTWESETGESQVQSLFGLHCEFKSTLSKLLRIYLNKEAVDSWKVAQ